MIDYLRDPREIYRRSFAAIRAEAHLDRLPADIAPLALRVVHACGMPEIVDDLAFSAGAGDAGRAALARGATILCDARMVAEGIIASRLPAGVRVLCTLDAADTAARAQREATTRSAAAVAAWRPHLAGAIAAIGNAPTALFRLLEELDGGAPKPALILGFPVGFVGAAESKAALARDPRGCAFVTVHGRRGGSAMAAAAVNALLGNAEEAP
ncbi:MAG: precorrin-8X methylmutase [Alphaproteobacteria bacterium]|nr:precorrin-8X methylmutase [Alphaproteobacteria bacterium]